MSEGQPGIDTARLVLRPFVPGDAPRVQQLAGHPDIADTTLNIPHPYEDGMAESWIETHLPGFEAGLLATFAIVLRDDDDLIGAIGLTINRELRMADLGYWVGKPYWNRGYATEATRALITYGFESLGLNRIGAQHLTRNPASGRVLEKAGMRPEGMARAGGDEARSIRRPGVPTEF